MELCDRRRWGRRPFRASICPSHPRESPSSCPKHALLPELRGAAEAPPHFRLLGPGPMVTHGAIPNTQPKRNVGTCCVNPAVRQIPQALRLPQLLPPSLSRHRRACSLSLSRPLQPPPTVSDHQSLCLPVLPFPAHLGPLPPPDSPSLQGSQLSCNRVC